MMPSRHGPMPEIPPDRADGSRSLVHNALVLTGTLGQIAPVALFPAWLALAAIASWPWHTLQLAAGLVSTAFLAADWAMLALLPVKQRSWGPVTPSLLSLTLVRTGVSWATALIAPTGVGLAVLTLIEALLSAVAIYATWIEPFRVGVTREHYRLPQWYGNTTLNVLHLSDIHFEGWSTREKALLEHVAALKPDLILMTGDYLNLSSVYDPAAQAGARRLLSQIHAPLGVYAITGSPVVDIDHIVPRIFAGLDVHWLVDDAASIEHAGQTIHLLGIRTTYDEARDAEVLTRLMQTTSGSDAFTLLLYHTPDLMPVAAQLGVDLYLCGHTHGGQIRLPFYGALTTGSRWGKRYEMGRYQEDQSILYVSRGLGMEGLGAPRARLLAPPEIILWTLGGG